MADAPCRDCGQPYSEVMALDLVIPRSQWLLIHPEDGGVLCANCLVRRASKLPGVINLTAMITFGEDYDEDRTPYDEVSDLVRARCKGST